MGVDGSTHVGSQLLVAAWLQGTRLDLQRQPLPIPLLFVAPGLQGRFPNLKKMALFSSVNM